MIDITVKRNILPMLDLSTFLEINTHRAKGEICSRCSREMIPIEDDSDFERFFVLECICGEKVRIPCFLGLSA